MNGPDHSVQGTSFQTQSSSWSGCGIAQWSVHPLWQHHNPIWCLQGRLISDKYSTQISQIQKEKIFLKNSGKIFIRNISQVETIGDAYMVVSGLPLRNGQANARKISTIIIIRMP